MDIHSLCKSGDLKNLRFCCEKLKILAKNNDFLYKTNSYGELVLDVTVLSQNFECCKYLVETFNANPLKINELGHSAFSYSLELSRHKFLKYFIENRKNFSPAFPIEDFLTKTPVNKSGMCSFSVVLESSHPDCGKTLIYLIECCKLTFQLRKTLFIEAIKISNILLIEYILNIENLRPDERKELLNLNFNSDSNFAKRSLLSEAKTTPLIYAIEKEDRQLVNFLLAEDEIDVNGLNMPINDTSPLHSAIKLNDIETVMLLLEKDVKKEMAVGGVLPIEQVIKIRADLLNNLESKDAQENWIIFELLATSSSEGHLPNNIGMCALDYAVKSKVNDVVQHFVSLKCDIFKRKNKLGKAPIDYADTEILTKVGFLDKTIQRRKSEKTQNEREFFCNKFEGTILGLLIGDCLGKCLEGIWSPNLNEMLEELRLAKEAGEESGYNFFKCYSDDTALTRAVFDSIIQKENLNLQDIVERFLEVYYNDQNRGFSSASKTLFKKLSYIKAKNEFKSRHLIPSMELFDGEGSYGSGGAMRCAPIALFTFLKPLDEMKIFCELCTKITHTHKFAVIGAVQQCFTIRLALYANKNNNLFDLENFYLKILNFVYDLELNYEFQDQIKAKNLNEYPEVLKENVMSYLEQKKLWSSEKQLSKIIQNSNQFSYTYLLLKLFKIIKKCRRGQRINMQALYKIISSYNSTAIESIPLSLFSFMIASDLKCENEVNLKLNTKRAFKEFGVVERVIFYAVSFGGEAQKIASMAGAIAGAFHSSECVPKYLVEMCESCDEMRKHTKQLFEMSFNEDQWMSDTDIAGHYDKDDLELENSNELSS
ncbi:poly(ADP-ribose) glycohydrolase ARH3-like [Brachionus plicatilis]|uniref:ADP-ribosylhydrolase ARH3 n=1 Tax=Brachionus plicatilis TaxID=10195 RepID=A0A3M7RHS8_BRAPC|nr:poly(ADP-ribose) glycohydrolase ARH3-like [Brachionus plicatilis]